MSISPMPNFTLTETIANRPHMKYLEFQSYLVKDSHAERVNK